MRRLCYVKSMVSVSDKAQAYCLRNDMQQEEIALWFVFLMTILRDVKTAENLLHKSTLFARC